MPLLTFIARANDGLLLVASIDAPGVQANSTYPKQILRSLDPSGPTRMTIEAPPHAYSYIVENGVCYLTMTEQSYPSKRVFEYLVELRDEFERHAQAASGGMPQAWQSELMSLDRPYRYIKFESVIQRKRRAFLDPSSGNVARLNDSIADIHTIMRQNINQVLARGRKLDEVAEISSDLVDKSKQIRWHARQLNMQRWLRSYAPFVGIVLIVLLVSYYKFFM